MYLYICIARDARRKCRLGPFLENNYWQWFAARVIIILSRYTLGGVTAVPGRRPKINIPGDPSGTLSGNARLRPTPLHFQTAINTRARPSVYPRPKDLMRSLHRDAFISVL